MTIAPRIPPTTPPAIAPAFDRLSEVDPPELLDPADTLDPLEPLDVGEPLLLETVALVVVAPVFTEEAGDFELLTTAKS